MRASATSLVFAALVVVRTVAVLGPARAGSPPAAGPSFDCAKAVTAHERLICEDPYLARLDAALAGAYRAALDGLPPDGRERLSASQRAWIAYSRAVCPIPYPIERPGIWFDAAGCLQAEYRARTGELARAVRQLGPFTVVRLDAYRLVRLGPDDPGARYVGGLAIDHAMSDWIDPEAVVGEVRGEAERLDAGLLHARLETAAPRFQISDHPAGDEDAMDADAEATITAVTPLIVTSRGVDWRLGHGTPHGWGYTRYGARWVADGRPVEADDLFLAGTPWASTVEARINAETRPFSPIKWDARGQDLSDVELRPDAFAVDAGYVDGYAGGEKVVAIPWADLKRFMSARGRAVVDSFAADRHGAPRDP